MQGLKMLWAQAAHVFSQSRLSLVLNHSSHITLSTYFQSPFPMFSSKDLMADFPYRTGASLLSGRIRRKKIISSLFISLLYIIL